MSPSLLLRTSSFALLHYYTMLFFLKPKLGKQAFEWPHRAHVYIYIYRGRRFPHRAQQQTQWEASITAFITIFFFCCFLTPCVHSNPLFRDKEKGAILHAHACSRTNTAINVTALPVLLLLDKGKHRWKPVRKYNRRTHLLCLIISAWRGQ